MDDIVVGCEDDHYAHVPSKVKYMWWRQRYQTQGGCSCFPPWKEHQVEL